METYVCKAPSGPLDASLSLPGSKSLTNRALIIAALADGESVLSNALFAEDTEIMLHALEQLGVPIEASPASCRLTIRGGDGAFPESEGNLFCGNSGTSIRFLAAMLATGVGRFELDGKPRMRERPIGDLMDVLASLGSRVEYGEATGFPPVVLHANRIAGGHVGFRNPPSSQMVSALLMASPLADSDMMIQVVGKLISRPYIDMTISVMEQFGVTGLAQYGDDARFIIPPQRYVGTSFNVEPDASNATYFLAAAAIAGGRVTVPGLTRASMQGDVRFADVLGSMGCRVQFDDDGVTVERDQAAPLCAVDIDLTDMPDTAQTLAVVSLFAVGETVMRGLSSLRVKETDRLQALENELSKLGASVSTDDESIRITPPDHWQSAVIETYDDHRMAMSFALAGLRGNDVTILDPGCCSKTFPTFFDVFEKMLQTA